MVIFKEKTLSVNFEDLKLHHIKEAHPNILKVIHKGVSFQFKIILKNNTDNLVVFFNGAYDPAKNQPPIFARSSWYRDYNANCIFVDDPTVHDNEITVGWGIGDKDVYYFPLMSEVIIKLSKFLKVYPKKTVYYGSSAGGFMSLAASILHKNSTAVINNPQVHVRSISQGGRYYNLINSNFAGLNEYRIQSMFSDRFNVIEQMHRAKYIPKVFYLLNRDSREDVELQFRIFEEYVKSRPQEDKEKIEYILYSSDGGHNGMYDREKTAALINNILKSE
ncbi:hypothetical protein [Jeotgalicoccus marinus]|uniref:hypothetical protein n=1 Tax=Jeotgalicoccus marinus TaxID=516700 RepID=UPI00041A080A|nr:hypothetical protein [Jeotgalicoccus marinus]